MARFASTFGLNLSQAELDFVDVDTASDNNLYLDPYAIQIRADEWSARCGDYIRSFFNEVLDQLRVGNVGRVAHLLSNLHEPNETFLGVSEGPPNGRAIGSKKAADLANALRQSRAFNTGLLSDISEAELFIVGIGPDTISDLTTNILRGLLAEYTAKQCELHEIPLVRTADLGPTWSTDIRDWRGQEYMLPVSNQRPVLLVPKFSVRRKISIDSQEFWNFHMVEFLRQEYLDSRSALIQTFKDGTPYVTKKSVKEIHPKIKDDLAAFIQKHPEVLQAYKDLKGAQGSLESKDFDEEFDERAFARVLIDRLALIQVGNVAASEYHSISLGISTFIFHPSLIYPIKEREIHEGRKRVDIKFTNAAQTGFFFRMVQLPQTRSNSIFIECKNYTKDVHNPELDQLAMRFGPQRGYFGMMFCRNITNRNRIVASCRDVVADNHGYMLVFEDSDLVRMLEMIERDHRYQIDPFLQERFDEITL
jgi:hypothetical protein